MKFADNKSQAQRDATKAAILVRQDSACAICMIELRADGIGAHLDHDHDTDEIRGVLCMPCNISLGKYEIALAQGRANVQGFYNKQYLIPAARSYLALADSDE